MMHCEDVRPELLGYHLGTCERPLRDDIDVHVMGCRDCLSTYLRHKRTCDDAAAFDERPSERVRQRLRATLALRSPPKASPPKRGALWLMGVAAAAFVLAGVTWVWRGPVTPSVDTRPAPLPRASTPAESLVDSASRQTSSNFL